MRPEAGEKDTAVFRAMLSLLCGKTNYHTCLNALVPGQVYGVLLRLGLGLPRLERLYLKTPTGATVRVQRGRVAHVLVAVMRYALEGVCDCR